jgi:hypothetical protein
LNINLSQRLNLVKSPNFFPGPGAYKSSVKYA